MASGWWLLANLRAGRGQKYGVWLVAVAELKGRPGTEIWRVAGGCRRTEGPAGDRNIACGWRLLANLKAGMGYGIWDLGSGIWDMG